VPDWKSVLSRLVIGDIFHAACPNGASFICLVEAIANDRIVSRRITTQECVDFELTTGLTLPASDEVRCAIDSITPLPVAMHNVLLGLERKMRLCRGEKVRLNEEEKEALKFVADFYPANPVDEE
jgi:hypothetical protein